MMEISATLANMIVETIDLDKKLDYADIDNDFTISVRKHIFAMTYDGIAVNIHNPGVMIEKTGNVAKLIIRNESVKNPYSNGLGSITFKIDGDW